MNITETYLKELESLLREGSSFLHKFYPHYTPRNKDEGHFNIVMHARQFKHDEKFSKWHKQIVRILDKKIKSDFYVVRFEETAHPNTYTLSAPDGYYWGTKTLKAIILELRKIYFAEKLDANLNDRTNSVTACFEYRDPDLILILQESKDKYLVHSFRKGAPKRILDFAQQNSTKKALKSHFQSDSKIRKRSFKDIFRQFLEDENLKTAMISQFLKVETSKLEVNENSFILTKKEVRKIHQNFKKFE